MTGYTIHGTLRDLLKVIFSHLQSVLSDFQAAHANLPLKHVPVPYLYHFTLFAVWGFKAS